MLAFSKMKITRRERLLLGLGIGLLLPLLFIRFCFSPGHRKMKRLAGAIVRQEKDLKEMIKLRDRYQGLEAKLKVFEEGMAQRPAGFTLFSYLESLATQSGMGEKIDYLKPRESAMSERYKRSLMKMKLTGITIENLTRYLHLLESSPYFLQVRRVRIMPQYGSQGLLDVTFEVSTFLLAK